MKKADEQKIVKQLSSCLIEKYNCFTMIRIEYEKKERKNFQHLISFTSLRKTKKQNHFVILLPIFRLPILPTIYALPK